MDTIINMITAGLVGAAIATWAVSRDLRRTVAELAAEVAKLEEGDNWQIKDFVVEDCSADDLGPNEFRGRGVPCPAGIDFDPPIPPKNNGDTLRIWQDGGGTWYYALKKAEK